MKILAVGGGSGGHITPVVAVLRELRRSHPEATIRFWCDKKMVSQARDIMINFDSSIVVETISAGKLRRYHHLSVARQLLWPSLVLANAKDIFRVIAGFFQSLFKLLVWRPDVVFTKGGYVCLPVGIAARLLRIPLVIHDSDAHPGLTNRILGKWANRIATGAPLEHYSYPADKSRYVGIPIASEFHTFSAKEKIAARKEWGIDESRPLIVVTGGGLGARRINDTIMAKLDELKSLGTVVLISGSGQYDEIRQVAPKNDRNFQLHGFVSKGMAQLLGAADVVVTRAGATTILELASLSVPTILIPNGKLTGGHQLKNAIVYEQKDAVVVVDENKMSDDPSILVSAVKKVLSSPEQSDKMARSLATFARPHAAQDVADMIIESVK